MATILLADDDEGHSLLVTKGLREAGLTHDIICFHDGQEILDFLGEGNGMGNLDPQGRYILVLDIRMPMVDGVDVLRRIRQSDRLMDLPVIMLTTTYSQEEIALCHRLGCNAFMVKSRQHREFSKTIQTLGNFLQDAEFPALRSPSHSVE